MKFNEVFTAFISGDPIKRKKWAGYWKYKDGEIVIYTREGTMLNIRNVLDIPYTFSNIAMEDWEIATETNSIFKMEV